MATAMKMDHHLDGPRILLNVSPKEAQLISELLLATTPAMTAERGLPDREMISLFGAFETVGVIHPETATTPFTVTLK
jgi:hypothetical protein